ncbi:5-bromo-4-chloroindolyl phosphate hydrolysis family protein [Marinibacterium sp. SX1]|uniref:5-bromo-4-chloroindolyl phosphate hydrolysis family protein n=1 Tax=Marinibacterium sp. SX1 TaxID=3388424 RepID=UPI003D17ACAD
MAQRFGGKYSPTGADEPDAPGGAGGPSDRPHYHGAQADPAGARTNVLFLPSVVLVATSLSGGAMALATGLIAAGLLAGAAFLTREGLRAEVAFNARRVARKPALPRKILAALLTAAGTAAAAFRNDGEPLAALIYGLAAGGLYVAAFGIDPLRDKGTADIDDFQQARVARVVDEAEAYLRAMSEAVARAGDRTVQARVERFQATAREMIRTVEEDPRDLTAGRKYLGVYLMGARDASVKFADLYLRTRDTRARADYIALLDDLEQNFAARTARMLQDDRTDLTIEIDVLRDRLQQEGVRLDG